MQQLVQITVEQALSLLSKEEEQKRVYFMAPNGDFETVIKYPWDLHMCTRNCLFGKEFYFLVDDKENDISVVGLEYTQNQQANSTEIHATVQIPNNIIQELNNEYNKKIKHEAFANMLTKEIIKKFERTDE